MSDRWVLKLQYLICYVLFGLIILGAGVRIADAGLACPDWPFCFGKILPDFNFQIFMEWIHRKIAAVSGLIALTIAVTVWSRAHLRASLGAWVVFCLVLFAFQAWLGMQTVIQLLKAETVASHLMGGYSLLGINLFILGRMQNLISGKSLKETGITGAHKTMALTVLIIAFLQATLGGTVSSHYAGMACPDFPKCHGEWWPELSGPVAFHYMHRIGAYLLCLAAVVSAVFFQLKSKSKKLRFLNFLGLFLILLQIVWGVLMIFNLIHPALSILHSATAISIFTTYFWSTRIVFAR